MKNVSDESCREDQYTHFVFSAVFLRSNVQKYFTDWQAADDDITLRMRIACWVSKVTNTHLDYVILIAFYQQ